MPWRSRSDASPKDGQKGAEATNGVGLKGAYELWYVISCYIILSYNIHTTYYVMS